MLNPDFRDMLSEFNAAGVDYLILTAIDGVEFDEAYPERVIARVGDIDVPFVGLRHLLMNKRSTGRPEDLTDVTKLESARSRPH